MRLFPTGDYTFDLIQRREDDTVVGGETFHITLATVSVPDPPIIINTQVNSNGTVTLTADAPDYSGLTWLDGKNTTIDSSGRITVNPVSDGRDFAVVAFNKDGNMVCESITLEENMAIKEVSVSSDKGKIYVELAAPAPENAMLIISSVTDTHSNKAIIVSPKENNVKVDISDLASGMYAVAYSVNGQIVDSRKISK